MKSVYIDIEYVCVVGGGTCDPDHSELRTTMEASCSCPGLSFQERHN